MTISFFCDILWETRGFIVINSFSKKYGIPRYDRGADGELKLASFCLSGRSCSAPGRLDLVQLHALTACNILPPPPPLFKPFLSSKSIYFSLFSQNSFFPKQFNFLFGKNAVLNGFCVPVGTNIRRMAEKFKKVIPEVQKRESQKGVNCEKHG